MKGELCPAAFPQFGCILLHFFFYLYVDARQCRYSHSLLHLAIVHMISNGYVITQ